MKFTKEKIKDIAQELQAGMDVYINRKTLDTESIMNPDHFFVEPDFWEKEIERIENEWEDYVVISQMSSHEAYEVMEEFAYQVDDEKLREELIKILNRKSPFANFKAEIDESDYREKWFGFRDKKYKEYVREELLANGFKVE